MTVNFIYDKNENDEDVIYKLAKSFEANLLKLTDYCNKNQDKVQVFNNIDNTDLSIDDIGEISDFYNNI